tara:strand:- start:10050 stop:12695 length:2646 start_codon:yes stop_codon:yes gene_type:complete
MKLNFRKISALATSALMTVSSVGFAAAANYPQPFVVGGTADVAIVYGTGSGVSTLDIIQAGNVQSNLQSNMGSAGSSTSGSSVSGEAVELFSGGTKIYVNDSLNTVKNVLTKSNLPTVLKEESFSGNVDATITQTIDIGSNPRINFKKQPTSSDDPDYGLQISTTTANYIYNATATFSKAIAFNHSDSEGEGISLFGQTFTVGSATDATDLVLLQSAEKLSLDSDSPAQDVTIGGSTYTVELVSASDSAATVKVTNSAGASESKEINEAASKKVQGITIAVTNADETNLKLSASIVAGSEKVTLTDGSEVTIGEDDAIIDGATAHFTGGTSNLTKLVVSVVAAESDEDAIKAGESFTDPVFKSFKLDFSGLNIADDSATRETISITTSGDDKLEIEFTEHRGTEHNFVFAKNTTGNFKLIPDDDNHNLTVFEDQIIKHKDFVVVGNEDEGYLLQVSALNNATTGTANDRAKFTDVFSGDSYETTWTSDGEGTVSVGGKSYSVTMTGDSNNGSSHYNVRINYPDSSGAGTGVMFPTIQTAKGARLAFYQPTKINLSNWDGGGNLITQIDLPDGDGYTSISGITPNATVDIGNTWNFTADSTVYQLNTSSNASVNFESFTFKIGQLTYNMSTTGKVNETQINLHDIAGTTPINVPAVVIFEEKDDNNVYEALIVKLENGVDADDGIGVDDVERTWSNDSGNWEHTMPGDSKIQKDGDLWGTIITTDSSDSDQKSAVISYPDEQVYAQLYMGEVSASITAGSTSSASATQLGEVLVKDSEVSSVSTKNLVIIGGSCINSAAASVLGGANCGAAFTESTGVGSGQFLIKGVSDSSVTSKLALVVAGYEATDTVNAAKYLTTKTVDTAKEYKGTSATTAEMVVTTA